DERERLVRNVYAGRETRKENRQSRAECLQECDLRGRAQRGIESLKRSQHRQSRNIAEFTEIQRVEECESAGRKRHYSLLVGRVVVEKISAEFDLMNSASERNRIYELISAHKSRHRQEGAASESDFAFGCSESHLRQIVDLYHVLIAPSVLEARLVDEIE